MGGGRVMSPSPLLKVSGLCKNFGGVQAINDLNFEIAEGELLGMIGPNGSGKTTAVNLITGFVKPTEGEIRYRGKNITGWPPYKIVRIRDCQNVSDGKAFLSAAGLQKYDYSIVFATG